MDPKEGDNVRFKHKRVETTGTVIKRSGTRIRVQPKDGGATLWKELSELLPIAPAVDEASEIEELQRLFSSGPSSARANALSTRGVQAAAKQTVSERPNKIGMPTPMPKPAVGPLQAAPPDMKREVFEAAPPPPHRPAIGLSRLNAFHDGGDTNLDGIDDDDDAVLSIGAPSELLASRTSTEGSTPLPPKQRQALTELDKIVIQVLLSGAIRLLCVKWLLMQPANFKMPNRQALEKIERSGVSSSPLLSPQEAVALVERGDRSIGTLTYGWLSPGDPDPKGSRFRVLRRALMGMAIRIEALFWDFGSLYQAPRTSEQSASFKLALEGGAMNQLYASILATTVLQIDEIPPRPAEFDGVVCLFKLSANVDEDMVRAALIGFGTIESCDLSHRPPIVRFASHLSAVKAKDAGVWPGLCEGLDTLYNETPYFSRGW
jgi:predicted DNA-binding ribbon-helix-helix protein